MRTCLNVRACVCDDWVYLCSALRLNMLLMKTTKIFEHCIAGDRLPCVGRRGGVQRMKIEPNVLAEIIHLLIMYNAYIGL